MQLSQTEPIGAMDQDGIGVWHVDAGFNDGGTEQEIDSLLVEIAHDLFQFPLAHLPMGHGDARFRKERAQALMLIFHGLYFVIEKIQLSSALQFAQDCLTDQTIRLGMYEGFDGQAFLRGRGDDREIAQSLERQGEGAGNGGGRESEYIHFGAQGFEALLLTYPETVLLIDDDQPQARKADVFSDQFMGADDQIDFAFFQGQQGRRDFLGGAEAGQFGDPHRPICKTIGKVLKMLFGQQGGGDQQGNLAPRMDCLKSRAHGHFRLAKPHVTTDQPIHGFGGSQIGAYGSDGGGLIGGFLEREACGKGGVGLIIQRAGPAGTGGAPRIEIEQFGCGIARLTGGLSFGFFPLSATQSVQRCGFRRAARVTADQMQLSHGDIQDIVAGIG